MNILAVSGDFSIGDMCDYFVHEGHNLKIYIEDSSYHKSTHGRFVLVNNWRDQLEWVGKDGLIVFDSTGFGMEQDELRQLGYAVIGGSAEAERCEDDREYGQQVLKDAGLSVLPTHHFTSPENAIDFIHEHPKQWVLKHNGHVEMTATHIGKANDGSDVIETLSKIKKTDSALILQERVHGIEIGVARYFNGTDWVGPIEYNIEHKRLEDDDKGPTTWEMGTLMWFTRNESTRLFAETLARLKPFLVQAGFRGDVDINCIVNERGVYPLEWTARFGFPALQLQHVLATSSFTDFLHGVAKGEICDFEYADGYGVTVLVAVPPFPYSRPLETDSFKDTLITYNEPLTSEEISRIHFEDVYKDTDGNMRISSENGFVMHVSGKGSSVEEARLHAYTLIQKITIPKMFYRTDIGLSFTEKNQSLLKQWKWIS
jgi:phosphoribosylamine---glycine ligase